MHVNRVNSHRPKTKVNWTKLLTCIYFTNTTTEMGLVASGLDLAFSLCKSFLYKLTKKTRLDFSSGDSNYDY